MEIYYSTSYGTRKWEKAPPYTKESTTYFTQKEGEIYAIVREWQEEIAIQNVAKPSIIRLLGFKGEVKFSYKNNVLRVIAPTLNPSAILCQYAWAFEITP
jgi:alpha-L-fucosidase